MLHKIPLISAVLFSILYPLCFWISGRSPLRQQFHHFHTGLPCCVAGICAVWICSAHFPLSLKIHFCVWVLALLLLSASQWARAYADYRVMSLPSLIGISALCHLLGYWQPVTVLQLVILLLGGAIFCASLYAMNLGHWYLNVHGLPVRHLKNAVIVFGALLALRLVYDLYGMFTMTVMWDGEPLGLIGFMSGINGIFLSIAVFFGTLFPLISLYFVFGTLSVKNTQSATGILYAILCSVVIGDITYKYFWLQHGIVL